MQNAISLLGSTGSVGRQTLEVAALLGLDVRALSAGKNTALLEEQTRRFKPVVAAVFDEDAANDFKARVRDMDVRVVSGPDGLIEAACVSGADTVVTAVVGAVGLRPTLAAIETGRRIALANKETLVCAGELVMSKARAGGAEIIPVDSELSAVFQCIRAESHSSIKKIILTASGGPFRVKSKAELHGVTPGMALRHPNWDMGRKITIDSATLMNKGFEVIEAVRLFSVAPGQVEVVVHPESVIHSMVEFNDNSVTAQLAAPDMRLPIQYALTYPKRMTSLTDSLDIAGLSRLTFEKPDTEAFPCLSLAIEAVKTGGTACAILGGANEAAVDLFLKGTLDFYGIHDSVRSALEKIPNTPNPTLEDCIAADTEAKRHVYSKCIMHN